MKATTRMRVILKFRQVHVDKVTGSMQYSKSDQRATAFRSSTVCRRAMKCEMKSQRLGLEAGQEGEIHLSRTAARRGIYHRADRAERGRLFGRVS